MTEDDAKNKTCVQTLAAAPGTLGMTYSPKGCIGSDCMAWRWNTVPNPEYKPRHTMVTGYPENPYAATPAGIASTTDGYCGLAGVSPRCIAMIGVEFVGLVSFLGLIAGVLWSAS